MRALLNPVHKRGHRNVLCPHYDECLNHAVHNHWRSWDCSRCPFNMVKKRLTDVPDVNVREAGSPSSAAHLSWEERE